MKKTLLLMCAFVVVTALACSAQDADAPGHVCSNQTLHGDYGFTVTGFRVPAPGVVVPMEGTALTHFDGNGNLTQTDNINTANGPLPADRPATGTYQLNADCSGTMSIVPDGQPQQALQLRIVVVDNGKEIRTGVVTPGVVVTSNGRKK